MVSLFIGQLGVKLSHVDKKALRMLVLALGRQQHTSVNSN